MANIDSLLQEHVTFELESIDRIYLNGYVPKLHIPAQLVGFLCKHRGNPLALPALLGRMTREWVVAIERYAPHPRALLHARGHPRHRADAQAHLLAVLDPSVLQGRARAAD